MKNVKKWKRLFAAGIAAVMTVSLAACSGGAKDEGKDKNESGADGKTVTFWNSFTGADGDMLVKLVNRFNEENQTKIKTVLRLKWIFLQILIVSFLRHLQQEPALR